MKYVPRVAIYIRSALIGVNVSRRKGDSLFPDPMITKSSDYQITDGYSELIEVQIYGDTTNKPNLLQWSADQFAKNTCSRAKYVRRKTLIEYFSIKVLHYCP